MTVSKKRHRRILFALTSISLVFLAVIISGFILLMQGQLEYHKKQTTYISSPGSEIPSGPSVSQFLDDEENVIVNSATSSDEAVLPIEKVLFQYILVTGGCGIHFQGECLNVRSGPGVDFPVVAQLRNEIVLKVKGQVIRDGMTWYKIVFDELLLYPERVENDWYVSADFVEVLLDEGSMTSWENGIATTTKVKEIIVDRSEQMLYAYEDGVLFMEIKISTGLQLTPTPRGTFTVFKKTPSRYMQGPLPGLPSDQYYDLPGVPWDLYFTHGGAVIHGAYWHDSFGSPYSHGCVNVSPVEARILYNWTPLGTKVVVRD